ncbi:ArdC family protein [Fusobacterium sp. HMSC073F01]|uniref:ArdC family protein n=1 Tax=Fusobacterium sp. HMSC073F01 TaxID=1739251 RepID=UPI0008A1792D|nr:zincin-like metallopeptidase domain-containing protein [Fusobacterium sp. HMSC073F01]OFL94141.1 hypothetical protein HMPREF2747_16385 [Fusobacterium sp. HMSC073F01]
MEKNKKTAFEIVMENRKEVVEELIKSMEEGYVATRQLWDKMAVRPQNPVSQIYYRGGNRFRLSMEAVKRGYKDPRWLTYNQATENGWQVKKGEKGVLCEKWIFSKIVKEKDEKGIEIEKEVELDKPIVNYFKVFNAEQIAGIPELEKLPIEKGQVLEIAEDMIATSMCPIKEVGQEQAYYSPSKDEIVLPLRESFKDSESFLSTALHEMMHSTGHESRLNRGKGNMFGSPEYAKEELIAELGSVFLQGDLGIKLEGEHFQDHSNYLKSWIGALKEDYHELFRACIEAEKGSQFLYSNYLEREKEQVKDLQEKLENKPLTKPLDKLQVIFHWSEKDFGLAEETSLRGEKAYNFIKQLMDYDKEKNKERERNEKSGYDKTKISLYYGGECIKEKIRIDLGDLEFGKDTQKVSDGLEYRLMLYVKDVRDSAHEYSEMSEVLYGEKKTKEEILADTKEMEKEIKDLMKDFRERENKYLKSKDQEVEKESKVPGKKNAWAKPRSRSKTQENER